MNQNLSARGWYRTDLENPYNVQPIVDVQKLADALPHGSGIDGSWLIQVRKNGNLRISSDVHRMDEHGSYCGWVGFSFRIERVKADELHPLSGPCAGKVQVLWRKGDIRMTAVRGGRDYNEYLDETIAYSLENIGLSKMGMETIEAPIVSVS